MDRKFILPEIPTGYEVFNGLISFVRPSTRATNLIKNSRIWTDSGYVALESTAFPTAEKTYWGGSMWGGSMWGGGYWGIRPAEVTSVSEIYYTQDEQYRGIFSLKCSDALVEFGAYNGAGAGTDVDFTSGTKYKFSVDIKAPGNHDAFTFLDTTGSMTPDTAVLIKTFKTTGRWQRLNWEFTSNFSGEATIYVASDAEFFYSDGWLLIEVDDVSGEPETYFDGDTRSFTTLPDFGWAGGRDTSYSVRRAGSGASGREVFLSDLGFVVQGTVGLGKNPVSNIATPLPTGGGYYQDTIPSIRQISLGGKIFATSRHEVMHIRRNLIDLFKPDRTPVKQPILMRIYNIDSYGKPITPILELKVVYVSGLEGALVSDYSENVILTFAQYDQFAVEDKDNSVEILSLDIDTEGISLFRRDGEVDALGSPSDDGFTVNEVRSIETVKDGSVYIGGNIPDLSGYDYHHIARFDGSNWDTVGTGFGNSENDIVHVVKEFGNYIVFGGETTGDSLEIYSKTLDAMASPTTTPSGIVYALEYKDDVLYVGGSFTDIASYIAKYGLEEQLLTGWSEIYPYDPAVALTGGGTAMSSDGTVMIAYTTMVYSETQGRASMSTDSGASWSLLQPTGFNLPWTSVAMSSDGTVIALGRISGYVYITTDSGTNWSQVLTSSDEWETLSMSSNGSVILAGNSARLYLSTNTGVDWSEVQPAGAVDKWWDCSCMSSDGSIILAGTTRLYLSVNSGVDWSEVQPAGDIDGGWINVSVSSNGSVIVAGNTQRLYLSTNTGASWSEIRPAGNIDKRWASSCISSDGSTILVGNSASTGKLYMSEDTGASWVAVNSLGEDYWGSCSMSSDGSSMIAQSRSSVYILENNWSDWVMLSADEPNDVVRCLLLSRDKTKLFVGGDFTTIGSATHNRIAYYDLEDETWVAMGVGFNNSVYDIIETKDGTVYACGTFTTIEGGVTNATFVARFGWQNDEWTSLENETGWSDYASGTLDGIFSMGVNRRGTLLFGGKRTEPASYAPKPETSLFKYANNSYALPVHQVTGTVYALEATTGGGMYIGGVNSAENRDSPIDGFLEFFSLAYPNVENATSYPEIHVRGPGILYAIENHTTNRGLYFSGLELGRNDRLIINVDPVMGMSITGVTNALDYLVAGSDTQFSLSPGVNNISISFEEVFEIISGDTQLSGIALTGLGAEDTNNGALLTVKQFYPCPDLGAGNIKVQVFDFSDDVVAEGSMASPYGEFLVLDEVDDSGIEGSIWVEGDETNYTTFFAVGHTSIVWKNRRWSISEDSE